MLLAIDPGASTGWALFANGRLRSCGLGEPPVDADSPWVYGEVAPYENLIRVIIECPRLRPRGEKNPNAILLVARNAGEWGGRYHGHAVSYVLPTDWKGSTPKKVDHRRTWSKLAPEEIEVLVIGCKGVSPRLAVIDQAIRKGLSESDKRANILDAVGIGLWSVKR